MVLCSTYWIPDDCDCQPASQRRCARYSQGAGSSLACYARFNIHFPTLYYILTVRALVLHLARLLYIMVVLWRWILAALRSRNLDFEMARKILSSGVLLELFRCGKWQIFNWAWAYFDFVFEQDQEGARCWNNQLWSRCFKLCSGVHFLHFFFAALKNIAYGVTHDCVQSYTRATGSASTTLLQGS